MTDVHDDGLIHCPTCAAAQPAAAECRRCKCDLNLYLDTLGRRRAWKRVLLQRLRDHRYDEAMQAARHYATLSPDSDAARWIAVILLLSGRFAAAVEFVSQPPRSSS
ncbi:MAG: tetratricopeptide repeat protein [Pirellulaceae bacterium]